MQRRFAIDRMMGPGIATTTLLKGSDRLVLGTEAALRMARLRFESLLYCLNCVTLSKSFYLLVFLSAK